MIQEQAGPSYYNWTDAEEEASAYFLSITRVSTASGTVTREPTDDEIARLAVLKSRAAAGLNTYIDQRGSRG